ncbi:MAG: DUF3047 domain-containing protein [Rhodobacteraceae bacterium]|nr:DUF3047 domain-containing protein [Paracoccaceae bacterium]
MRKTILAIAGGLALCAGSVAAQQVSFGKGWTEQKFSLFSSNAYGLNGQSLDVRSNGTVSLLWSVLPSRMWSGRHASWAWTVERSVPATDLTRKGGDDRNLSLYFLFLPEAMAQEAQGKDIRALLTSPAARVLMYVWGGDHARGDVLPSPYLGARGRSVIQRPAGTGSAIERVDLWRDHRRAFDTDPASLVGIAVSSDSDDTGTQVLARIASLRIE